MGERIFACEKVHIVPPADNTEYWRVLVFETDEDGVEVVVDITHHDKEEWADRWLADQWGVQTPPRQGERLRFSFDE